MPVFWLALAVDKDDKSQRILCPSPGQLLLNEGTIAKGAETWLCKRAPKASQQELDLKINDKIFDLIGLSINDNRLSQIGSDINDNRLKLVDSA